MELTHWKKLENPDYIGSYAFQPGEKKTLTIRSVTREKVHGVDGKTEECTIVRFAENEKPLILNATNGKMISKIADTPYIEQWAGKRIVLGVERVKAFGEVVEAVRVKKDKPAQPTANPAAIPPCADCGGAILATSGIAPERIVAAGMKRYGVPLCMRCVDKRKDMAAAESGGANHPTEGTEETDHADDQNQD